MDPDGPEDRDDHRLQRPCQSGLAHAAVSATIAFSGPAPFAVIQHPIYALAGDFNEDGSPDLAVASYEGSHVSILIGDGSMGPITKALHDEFFGIVNGTRPDRHNWLTPVNVKVAEPVGV